MLLHLLEPSCRLGNYEVIAHIATGGMGSVYKAVDVKLRRTVALKVLPADLAADVGLLERFHREARHAARLSHPNIVTLHEFGYDAEQGLHYLVLEFINGIDLGEHIKRKGQLPPENARRIVIQAARALEHAFAHGITHRDIKPSNFLMARIDHKVVIKLTDLGLARREDDNEFKVTRPGNTVGTIDYMAPEQARNSDLADIRSDIYSLGCTAYHMLAGTPPFAEGGLGERMYRHLTMPPTDVREFNPDVSEEFWAVLSKMLAKNPDDRYATPRELLYALRETASEASAEENTPTDFEHTSRKKTKHLPPLPETTPNQPTVPEPTPSPMVTLEQARTAASYHQRAIQVLIEGHGNDYARELIENCLKLDPFNTTYRKTLREINRREASGTLSRWFGSLNVLAIKSKMKLARSSKDWRKVLEHGEDVLARHPADADTHLEMAHAAQELGLPHLALWFLEQGHEQAPKSADLLRAMAQYYENCKDLKKSLELWQAVVEIEPENYDAQRKVNELSVREHIAGGHYQSKRKGSRS